MSQASFFNGNEVASGKDTGVSFPDLEKIANAYGIPYVAIKNNDEIDSQLSSAFSIEGPVIIELFSYPYEAHEPKVVHKGVNENGKIIPGELTNMYISDVFNL
jgi:acetolactate synthase-1/2/3 large subunit